MILEETSFEPQWNTVQKMVMDYLNKYGVCVMIYLENCSACLLHQQGKLFKFEGECLYGTYYLVNVEC